METETYKNAKVILERFDPEAKKKAVSAIVIFFFRFHTFLQFYLLLSFLFCLTVIGRVFRHGEGDGVDSSASSDDSSARTRYSTNSYTAIR